ncbi:MAG TPA: hypothetical protein VFW28_16695 [Micropepsaceae bacterium]|nr:hypothetical protein [Micropepsaceae bacterium]
MRSYIRILTIAAIGVVLGGSAIAAVGPSAVIRNPAPAAHSTATTQPDCEKVGSDVSALIDQHRNSPNIAQARAAFQLGIMECMEDDDVVANQHYADAKNLLAENFPAR